MIFRNIFFSVILLSLIISGGYFKNKIISKNISLDGNNSQTAALGEISKQDNDKDNNLSSEEGLNKQNENRILGVSTPINYYDGVSKFYVDNEIEKIRNYVYRIPNLFNKSDSYVLPSPGDLVNHEFLSNQVETVYNSVANSISESVSSAIDAIPTSDNLETLTVSGDASIGGLLSVAGVLTASSNILTPYITTDSTVFSSTFPYASTTALSADTICLTGDSCMTTWPTSATGSVFPFNPSIFGSTASNATSTLIGFTNGIYSLASSTIGDGTAIGGLTISGWATTTGNAYFASSIGVGTTSPFATLSINGNSYISGFETASRFVATSSVASIFPYASSTAQTISGSLYLGSLSGPLQAINGLISASSTLSVAYGGTGLSTAPSYGNLLVGNSLGGYTLTATSSLGLGSQWTTSGSNIYYNTGNVGIGTTSPWALNSIMQTTSSASIPLFTVASSTSGAGTSTAFHIDQYGKVGIGTNKPSDTLEVVGNIVSKGTKWASSTSAYPSSIMYVAYGGGQFVGVSSAGVMTSPDGINWTARGIPSTRGFTAAAYGNGMYVAVAGNSAVTDNIMSSPDGINWTTRVAPTNVGLMSVTYGNGLFVAVGASATLFTSPDGINWTSRSAVYNHSWSSVTYANGTFVAVAGNAGVINTVHAITSTDGITWTARTTGNVYLNSVTYGNGLFVAVGDTSNTSSVLTSPDGITWTTRTAPSINGWGSVTYGNGLFVAVSYNTPSATKIMTSPDGINWTPRTPPNLTPVWYTIAYGNGTFVATGDSGGIMYSGKLDLSIGEITQPRNIFLGPSVGIGTSSPWGLLSVTSAASTSAPLFNIASTSVGSLFNISNIGRVGIGTSTPGSIFSIAGVANFASTGSTLYSTLFAPSFNATSTTATSTLSGGLTVANSLFNVLSNNGYVGIGTSSPTFPLDVQSMVSSDQSYGYLNPSGVVGTATGVNNYSIRANGRIIAPEFNAVSDGRLKDVQFDIDPSLALNLVSQLQPVSFKWKKEPNGRPVLGFVAQSVEGVIPNAVTKTATENFSDQRSIDFNQILSMSVGAIKQLNITDNYLKANATSTDLKVLTVNQKIDLLSSTTDALSASILTLKNLFSIDMIISSTTDSLSNNQSFVGNIFNKIILLFETAIVKMKTMFVGELHIQDKLCVDDVCINKDQLKALLIQSNVATSTNSIPEVSPSPNTTPNIEPVSEPAPEPEPTPFVIPNVPTEIQATTTPPVSDPVSIPEIVSVPETNPSPSPEPSPTVTSEPSPAADPSPTPTVETELSPFEPPSTPDPEIPPSA